MPDKQTLYEDGRLYDLIHGEYAAPETLAFYQNHIAQCAEPILELACGTGHNLIPLAETGVDIVGLDISEEMLHETKLKAARRNLAVDVRTGDIRDFELNRKFALILLLGNSLQHLETLAEVESCFAAVKRHLLPNGKFIVEVFNPSLKLLSRNTNEEMLDGEYETDEGKMILTGKVNYDSATQINHITWRYANAATSKSRTIAFTMRQFFPQELDALFTYNNFRVEQKYGNRYGSVFNRDSPLQIVVACHS